MLQRLLSKGAKFGLFKDQPEVTEKYLIASEFTLEVLDRFLSHLFGVAACPSDASAPVEAPSGAPVVPLANWDSGLSGRVDEHDAAIEALKRQVCALQRQLQMQGDVVKVASSLEERLAEVSAACELRLRESERAVGDMSARVESAVARMKEELAAKASAANVGDLSAEVSRLKEAEQKLEDVVEKGLDGGIIARLRKEVESEGCKGEVGKLVGDAARVMAGDGSLSGLVRWWRSLWGVFYCAGDPLDGIIAHLTRECGGNVADRGAVAIRASGVYSSDVPKNAADLGTNSHFWSENKPGSWICYDFGVRRVSPTSYSIRSESRGPGQIHPKSWVFEASNDGSSWETLDTRDNDSSLNGSHVTRNFRVSAGSGGSFRFVRFHQTGKNHRGDDYIRISSFEVFGTLSGSA